MGYVSVSHRGFMTLRIELSATNLGINPPATQPTKLSLQAVTDLVELAEQCEVLCPTDRKTFGEDSPPDSEAKSWKRCPPFYRR